ncbi:MAG: TetR/AcrR family transcriptional regulator [Bacteroidetes bacterium]|nr:TetR/AcrR family transcriptional regulator [Bacteroidota bacterium]
MCPKTSEQCEEIRVGARRKILDAAIECFAASGYHAVSISDLARHAGVSKGLMYNYFSSKEELLKTIFDEVMAEMMDLFDPDHSGTVNRDTLSGYISRLFTHLKSNLTVWKMYMAIFSQPAVMKILEEEIRTASKQPLEMAERYFKEQEYKNPALEVAFLSTLISGVTYEYIADPENYPLNLIKKRILGLYPKSPDKKLKK